jgi:hypothetical protein
MSSNDSFAASGSSPTPDFLCEKHGSIFLLRPLSRPAQSWIEENLPSEIGGQTGRFLISRSLAETGCFLDYGERSCPHVPGITSETRSNSLTRVLSENSIAVLT